MESKTIRPSDLWGTWEVAAYLGWSSGQVTVYAKQGAAGMPAPFVHLRGGRVWIKQDIIAWAVRRGYKTNADPTDPRDKERDE